MSCRYFTLRVPLVVPVCYDLRVFVVVVYANMKPRLVEIGIFQEIISTSAEKNVAVFFYGSENVLLFGNENVLDQAVDEMIYALGYVPRYIRKESGHCHSIFSG